MHQSEPPDGNVIHLVPDREMESGTVCFELRRPDSESGCGTWARVMNRGERESIVENFLFS
jgi:hypothetical protein